MEFACHFRVEIQPGEVHRGRNVIRRDEARLLESVDGVLVQSQCTVVETKL